MFTSFIQLLVLIFVFYVCLYTIVNRICCCVEQTAISKSFSEFNKQKIMKDFEKNFEQYLSDDGK